MKSVCYGVAMVLGLGLVIYGAHLIYRPAGFLLAGLLLAAGGFFAAYDEMRKSRG